MVDLKALVKERILILDGAMGTMIQQYELTENDYRGSRFLSLSCKQLGNFDLLTLTRPDIITDIHRKYLDAGADIIETCSFNAQKISMDRYGTEKLCREINFTAANLARKIADEYTIKNPKKPRFVAGSIGPTNHVCQLSSHTDTSKSNFIAFEELVHAYAEQIEALLDGGVDALLIETIFDALNAKAAILAAENVMEHHRKVPIMLSVALSDEGGRTFSGQTLRSIVSSVYKPGIFSIGINCSNGEKDMRPCLAELAKLAPCYISFYPNAGLPNFKGEYSLTPKLMANQMKMIINEGLVNIIGGCCGTTDLFIEEFSKIIKKDNYWIKPHIPTINLPLQVG